MKTPRPRRKKKPDTGSWITVVADAHLAAATAQQMAAASMRLSQRAHAGEDDALDVLRAASRARQAAEQCEQAESDADAEAACRLAWAAVESAREADQRLNAAIAEGLTRPRRETAKGV
jgi:hypothetical protein